MVGKVRMYPASGQVEVKWLGKLCLHEVIFQAWKGTVDWKVSFLKLN